MATKKQILESDELLQQKRRAYYLSDEGFEEYKKFLSDPDQKKFCFKGYYYVEVKEQDDKELLGAMGRAIKNYAPDDILIISNQGGIEKGFVDKEMFEYKFDYISSALEDYTNISVYNFYCDNNDKDNINRKPNTGMIDQYMDYIKFINDNVDEENKIIYDTIMMIGDASGKEGQFSDSDKKTAENFGCEYMDVDDFVYKYNNR